MTLSFDHCEGSGDTDGVGIHRQKKKQKPKNPLSTPFWRQICVEVRKEPGIELHILALFFPLSCKQPSVKKKALINFLQERLPENVIEALLHLHSVVRQTV